MSRQVCDFKSRKNGLDNDDKLLHEDEIKIHEMMQSAIGLDSDLQEKIHLVELDHSIERSRIDQERDILDEEKSELSSQINSELKKIGITKGRLDSVSDNKYAKGSDKAVRKCDDLIGQLEGLAEQLESKLGMDVGDGRALVSDRAVSLDSINKDSLDETQNDTINLDMTDQNKTAHKTVNAEDEAKLYDIKSKISSFLSQKSLHNADADVPVSGDVESAQKMIDDYCSNYLKGFISEDKKNVRLNDTVTFQDEDEFARGLGGRARAEGINGYNDGKMSYVKNSGSHPKKTAIHEHNHQLSCNDVVNDFGFVTEYRRGVSINGRDCQVNEALTELFTKKMMGVDYPANPNVGYRDNMKRIERMEAGFGTALLMKAYYQNKPDLLKNKYDSVMGQGLWESLSAAFDNSLKDYSDQEIKAKREHYMKYGSILETQTDIIRKNAKQYADTCATIFAIKSKGK